MAVSVSKMAGFFVGFFLIVGLVSSAKFDELFQPSWALDHFAYEGELLRLKLDNYSGAGFQSKSKYMFGKVTVQIKLVEGDSAGTVTAFYMSSEGPYHNEFDFEFLGNTTGEPYLVQTNVFVNGVGNKEQRLNLWFDPTKDFHSYSLLWNQRQVVDTEYLSVVLFCMSEVMPFGAWKLCVTSGFGSVHTIQVVLFFDLKFSSCMFPDGAHLGFIETKSEFLVDETPIRLHTNMENKGIPFPKDQAMGVYSSIWNADDWATQGGRVKTDWSHAPFVASYKGFEIDACECPVSVAAVDNAKKCSSSGEKRYWWDEPTLSELSAHQSHQLLWVKANHMVYDYCSDTARFPVTPLECLHHSHRHH
ncbi:hypothetical protein POTOM_059688 [Populus tomentosa]|uniref:Xyloglucan endotransglucosylase/hydrolase n=1 Tax=Populus tomentosa TaxID=118781 RepID=A0A8X8C3A6_POPTO|nr:hypothetical protein POTOM_059688 [Populus tomentosa]